MHHIITVQAQPDFSLQLGFEDGSVRSFNARPLLDKGVFRPLQDWQTFRQARVAGGTVSWPGEIDLCPDTLYEKSVVLHGVTSE